MRDKHEILVKYVGVGPDHATFISAGSDELPFGKTEFFDMPLPIWHDMDNPHILTLTIVPGDQLNG
jgi:hypothetical protein